ncbi:hypothetical protein RB195_014734 [Necator americanus]|uniref:Uncharacterized protein n=1 Tax=Necator americanus TaxID=51031 RepID=A0ABR1E1D0_NECAM
MDNIDDEYERLVEHLHDCTSRAKSFIITKSEEQKCWLKLQRRDRAFAAPANFPSRKTTTTALRTSDGTSRTSEASRRGIEKVIHDFYSDFFDSQAHLPPHHPRKDGHVIPKVLSSEVRHPIMSVKNCTSPAPDRIKPEHLKYCCMRKETHKASATIVQSVYCLSSTSNPKQDRKNTETEK